VDLILATTHQPGNLDSLPRHSTKMDGLRISATPRQASIWFGDRPSDTISRSRVRANLRKIFVFVFVGERPFEGRELPLIHQECDQVAKFLLCQQLTQASWHEGV
jgi:hypothetical protein